jgi:hypothetical protein
LNARDSHEQLDSHAYLATAQAALGKVMNAREHFLLATRMQGKPLNSLRGLWEAEFRLASGDAAGAREQTLATQRIAKRDRWFRTGALCDTLLGRMTLADAPLIARQHLDTAREFASSSGDVEILLRSHRLAADLARHLKDLATAIAEAEAGILLADSCGCGLHGIDLRLALAEALLDAGDARASLHHCSEAQARATAPRCRWAWGKADALDLSGRAHLRLGEWEQGREQLVAALALRRGLGHAHTTSTRFALEELVRPDLDEKRIVVEVGGS